MVVPFVYTEEELQQEIRAKESWRDLYREECEKNKRLKELNKQMQENYNNLNDSYSEILGENEKLNERIGFLEQCLDNKEKVNQSLREELGKLVMKS